MKLGWQRWLATAFRPFTKVEPEESLTLATLTLAAFMLLTAYYLLKTVREPLILLQGGAEVKLYARAAQAIAMVAFVHFYGEIARRVGRFKLLVFVFLFFLSNLVLFAFLASTSLQIGLVFFLWLGVFSYTIVAQFWALGADIFTEDQGKRLFPIIGCGSSLGAVVGARIAKTLVPHGPSVVMGTAAGFLLLSGLLIFWVERRSLATIKANEERHPDEPLSTESAFALILRDKYLLLIGGMAVALNWVNSSGEYLLDRTLLIAAKEAAAHGHNAQVFVGAFKADYFAWYNLIALLLQLFAVSRILRLMSVRNALYIMPFFAFVAYSAAAALPVLAVMRWVKIGENSLQYSLQDTTRHALFLVASRQEKFVGKTAVDTIAVRIGAIMSAMIVFLASRGAWSLRTIAIVDVMLTVGWLTFVMFIASEHKRRVGEGEELVAKEPLRRSELVANAS